MRLGSLAVVLMMLAGAGSGQDEVLMRALTDELERSMSELRVEGLERPYFISYRVDEARALSVAASFGSLLASRESRSRRLEVEVRVGSYELDNTNFLTMPSFGARLGGGFGGVSTLTLDDDYREIRRQVWLATDAAFKAALEQLAQKKAVLQNKTLAEELDDFATADKLDEWDERSSQQVDTTSLERLAVSLSATFKDQPAVFDSRVRITAGTLHTWFVNSEGTRMRRTVPSLRLIAEATTQASDGMPLDDRFGLVVERAEELPDEDELVREVRAVGSRLTALRGAELVDRYNGPVLFEGQAAAELFAQGFAGQLLSRRDPVVGDERLAAFLNQRARPSFKDRIGARVLPRFMSVTDDPTLAEHESAQLLGGYVVDGQGVRGRRTALVERGYLKTMLAGRTPIVGVERSTGNHRGGGVAPSNLIVSASSRMTESELMAELLLLVEDRGSEYAVVVTRLGVQGSGGRSDQSGGGAGSVGPVVEAFKVYPDRRRIPLRNVELSGFAATVFKEIVAVGETDLVYSLPFTPVPDDPLAALTGRGTGSQPIVSVVVPSLLFEEMTLKKPGDEIPSLPVAGHPYFDQRSD